VAQDLSDLNNQVATNSALTSTNSSPNIDSSTLNSPLGQAANGVTPSLNLSGTTNYAASAEPLEVASNLTISDSDGGTLNGASALISSNFNASEDRLGIAGQSGTSGSINGLNWNYDTTTGVLRITGTASNETYQDVLRQITYTNTSGTPSGATRGIQFGLGTNLANPGNNHFYEIIPSVGVAWPQAARDAANRNYFGLKGYLATITSAEEQNFVQNAAKGRGWIGASNIDGAGNWQWVTGPEAGTQFWQGFENGTPVEGQYNNWLSGEPQDKNNLEEHAHIIGNPVYGAAAQGKWNDLDPNVEDGNYKPIGYIIEYGGLQTDPSVQLLGNVTVTLNPTATSSRSDFSGDGKPDILLRNRSTDETALWQMNGTTREQVISYPETYDTNWEIVGQADFTGDGRLDVLWRNYKTGENGIWEMNGTSFELGQESLILPTAQEVDWKIEGVSDFTGDARPDILWRNYRTGENGIWEMNGSTLQQSTLLTPIEDTAWEIKEVADFTGDGRDEILWRNNTTGENTIWALNGTTVQESIPLSPIADTAWDVAGVADFTGDDKVGVLWRNNSTGENLIWQMNGTTVEQFVALTPIADTAWKVEGLADFTSDGIVDILWRNSGTDESSIWQMNGTTPGESISLPVTGSPGWDISFPSYFPAGG
jgi:hypothetical protein